MRSKQVEEVIEEAPERTFFVREDADEEMRRLSFTELG